MPSLVADIARLVFPQHCACCGLPCDDWICSNCDAELSAITRAPRCGICAMPLPMPDAPCPRCLGRPRRLIRRIGRLGIHAAALRELVHRLKYNRRWTLARRLAGMLQQDVAVAEVLAEADLIVPVPLHWRRQISRGYNQSDLLARALARTNHIRVCRAIRRLRHTSMQTSMHSMAARVRNVQSAFAIRRRMAKWIAGKRIVLVDDVLTTGATLRAAARAIHCAKPARVDAVVLAIADPLNRDFTTVASA